VYTLNHFEVNIFINMLQNNPVSHAFTADASISSSSISSSCSSCSGCSSGWQLFSLL